MQHLQSRLADFQRICAEAAAAQQTPHVVVALRAFLYAAGETVATAVALGQAQILLAAADPDLAAESAALVQLCVRGGGRLGD